MEHTRLKRKISVLEKELQLKEESHTARISRLKAAGKRQTNAYKFQLKSLREKNRKATYELQAVENAFIQGLENHHAGESLGKYDMVFPKAMGIFDTEEEWYDDLLVCYSNDENGDTEVKEFMKFWEARIREPDFDASICEEDKDGNLKYTIRKDHEDLNHVLKAYGPEVYEAVCNAHLQVKAHGTSTVLWHYGENKKGTASEVLSEGWSFHFERTWHGNRYNNK